MTITQQIKINAFKTVRAKVREIGVLNRTSVQVKKEIMQMITQLIDEKLF